MFAYSYNCPILYSDPSGHLAVHTTRRIEDGAGAGMGTFLGFSVPIVLSSFDSSNENNVNVHSERKRKPINLPSWKKLKVDIEHITSGHMPGGPRNPKGNKTVFYGLTVDQVLRVIQEAYNHSSKVQTQGTRYRLIGYSSEFNIVIEIWLNIVDFVIETAYPKG